MVIPEHLTSDRLFAECELVARKEMMMTDGKKRRRKISSAHAKAALMLGAFMRHLAETLEDAGLHSDRRLEELCADKKLAVRIARMMRAQFLRQTNEAFRMVEEPPNRMYETTHRQGGPFINMIEAEFHPDKWALNNLRGVTGGFVLPCSDAPPDDTPIERVFFIWEVRKAIGTNEIERVLSAKGLRHAYFYDLVRVRDWRTPDPLFALGSTMARESNALLPDRKLQLLSRPGNHELVMQPGDRMLVWKAV